ncbi:MAG: 50S ribosomal protein L29 [Candidatus Acidiferrales bacterium]
MTRRIEKFREMNSNELQIQHRELSEQVFRLRFQLSSGQSEGLKKLREAKKDLARVNTLMRQAHVVPSAGAAVPSGASAKRASAKAGKSRSKRTVDKRKS